MANLSSIYFMDSSHFSRVSRNSITTPTILKQYDPKKKFTFYSEETDVLQNDNIYHLHEKKSLANLINDNNYWLDITNPDRNDLKTITELFQVHPLTIEDILSQEGREKTERFENYIFIGVRMCDKKNFKSNSAEYFRPSKIYILLFKNHVITIHSEPSRQLENVIRRVNPLKSIFKVSSDWFVYALIDDVVDEFIPNIKSIEHEVDSIDETVLYLKRTNQTEMLRRIGFARNYVNQLIRLLRPKIEIINILTKRHQQHFQEHTLLYLRDTQDHLMTMIQNLEQSSETLNRSHNNYLAQVSIELAEMSNRLNLQVKMLTQVTSLALPFAIIGGLWGMNVVVPFSGGGMVTWDELLPFWFLVGLSVLLSAGFWILGRKMKFF